MNFPDKLAVSRAYGEFSWDAFVPLKRLEREPIVRGAS